MHTGYEAKCNSYKFFEEEAESMMTYYENMKVQALEKTSSVTWELSLVLTLLSLSDCSSSVSLLSRDVQKCAHTFDCAILCMSVHQLRYCYVAKEK